MIDKPTHLKGDSPVKLGLADADKTPKWLTLAYCAQMLLTLLKSGEWCL